MAGEKNVAIFKRAGRLGSGYRDCAADAAQRFGSTDRLTPMNGSLLPAIAALAAAALWVAGLGILGWQRPRLSGTTLVAVWRWSVMTLLCVAAVEIAVALNGQVPSPGWVSPLRLAAAVSTFCPTMALLGAKRPQDRGWQFVVIALWGILTLPAVYWLLAGGVQEIHPAQLGFLAILIGVGLVNGLATRFWFSSVLFCLGQLVMLAPFFPISADWFSASTAALVGLSAIVAAWSLVAARLPPAREADTALDRVWLDFRDAFGAVWGLRVMERMNAASRMYGWPVVLTWSGFRTRDGSADVAHLPPAVEESLRMLLRRFVSAEWIDRRMALGPRKPVAPRPVAPAN
jgi:hypothetical protein